MIMEEARKVCRYGKAQLIADYGKALLPVGDRRHRAFKSLHVKENARRNPHRGFEQPEEMRPREADIGGKEIKIGDLPGDAFMSSTALRMRKSSIDRDASPRIEWGIERQSAKRSKTAITSSPRRTSCTLALLGSCTIASASVRACQRMLGVIDPTQEAKKSGALLAAQFGRKCASHCCSIYSARITVFGRVWSCA